MLDKFDLALLNAVQHDDSRTSDELAQQIALSPSAIARRLRRLRREGFIARTIALLSPRLAEGRVQALWLIQMSEHANQLGKAQLRRRLESEARVQMAHEVTGAFDVVALVDCATMAELNGLADSILTADANVRRYETSFVKQQIKFAPFVELT